MRYFMENLRELNIRLTKESLKRETPRDVLIIQTIHTIDELLKILNKLTANLRERYGYYAPKASREEDVKILLKNVFNKYKEDVGIDLDENDLNSMILIAKEIEVLQKLNEEQEKYLIKLEDSICPNISKCATPLIAARLIDHAGSLKHLAELPSSTIQVLGAEKALFRHLKTKAKPPKFGVIFSHPSISKALMNEKGKAARKVASEISKAVKIDYFRKR